MTRALEWWMYVIMQLTKPTECTTPRMNPNVNSGPWVIIICQRRFVIPPPLVGDGDSGEASRVCGGGIWKICYLLLNFAVNLKLL